MQKVLSYLKPYRWSMAIALILMFVELLVELWHPLLMAKVIDEGIGPRNLDVVLLWGAVMAGISLLGFACGVINSFFAAHASQGFGLDIRRSLFRHVQALPYGTFARFSTSSLITRMTSDVAQLQNVVFASLRIMLRAPLFMVFGVVMALTVNWRLALILCVVLPLLMWFMVRMMKRGFSLFRSVQERLDQTNSILRENLMGIRLIKAFVRDRKENERFSEAAEALMERTQSALRLVELIIPLLLLVMNVSILLILWFGRIEIASGGAELGEVVAVVNYATRIAGTFGVISMIIMNLSRGKASASRIAEVLNTELDAPECEATGMMAAGTSKHDAATMTAMRKLDPDSKRDGIASSESAAAGFLGGLEFDRVSFRYPGTSEAALQSISFRAEPGQTIALLGATGSGKTSLFQLIPRLYDAQEGIIRIDSIPIRKLPKERLRGLIGYVPQEVVLFTGTVKENLRWGREDAAIEEIGEAARIAQIHDTIMKLPQQYETMIGQKGVNLSGGQKQRLSIARALLRKPKLLLLDDCTSALDLQTEARLMEGLKTLSCTTLIITQKISTASEADLVLLLDEGKLLAADTHEQLCRKSELYQRIVRSQTREEASPYA